MTDIHQITDTELGKNVDAFALAVERFIGNEAGLEATRAHVAMLREAARRLSAPTSDEILASDMPAPDTFVCLPDGTRGIAAWYYMRGVTSITSYMLDQIIEKNGLEKKVIKLGILGELASTLRPLIQTGDTQAIRQHLRPYLYGEGGWKLFAYREDGDTFNLTYVRRQQTETEAA